MGLGAWGFEAPPGGMGRGPGTGVGGWGRLTLLRQLPTPPDPPFFAEGGMAARLENWSLWPSWGP